MSAAPSHGYPFPPSLPGDNRSNSTRFFDDVRDLSRLASIALRMHEDIYVHAHLSFEKSGTASRKSREKYLRDFQFVITDMEDRAALLAARCEALEEMLPEE